MQELIINILLGAVILTAAGLLIFISGKGGMTKKQRTMMIRIFISASVLLGLQFASAELFDRLDEYLFPSAERVIRFVCYLTTISLSGTIF